MTATASVSPSGNPYIDGVISGVRWGVNTLTFSFPTNASYYGTNYGSGENNNGFEALNTVQQSAVRSILDSYSSVANLTFLEVTESATVHGELRYAESDMPSTAWAYYPSTSAVGGDTWFNNSKNWYDSPAKGDYAWLTMLHETGHALGLKHAHESSGAFGALPADRDSLEYTVMSYRSYVGGSTSSGYTNGSTSYPQTLMMYDIAALQKMYGADFSTNAGDTVYRWNPLTGEMSIDNVGQGAPTGNKVFMTLWDGGGNDTYDFSNYGGGVKVDLTPGGWSTTSTTQLASLGSGKIAVGTIANALLYNGNTASLIEKVIGGSGNDTIVANVADNEITGGKGNDYIDGGLGIDAAIYSGLTSDYMRVKNSDGSWTVTDMRTGGDGIDTLKGIEFLKFADGRVDLGATVVTTEQPLAVNSAPDAVADFYTAIKGKLKVKAADGVLGNDSDADGDRFSAVLVNDVSDGKLSFKSDGSFKYKAPKRFAGTVEFSYKATDGEADSAATTVTLQVTASGSKARRGAEPDGHSAGADQIPDPAGSHASDAFFAAATSLATGKDLSHANPVLTAAVDPALAELFSAFDSFGDKGPSLVDSHHSAGYEPMDLAGLPDFMAMAFSEFALV